MKIVLIVLVLLAGCSTTQDKDSPLWKEKTHWSTQA